jgi:ATP-dependent Clp protease adapter protein ClpS
MPASTTAKLPVNPEVIGAVVHAARTAGRKTLDDAHLIAALARVGSVAQALGATGVDLARLEEGLARLLEALPLRPWYAFATASRPLQDAALLAHRAGLGELSGPFAFASLAALSKNAALLRCLAEAGFSLLRFRRQVAHGSAVDMDDAVDGPVRIVFHNDPFTTQELVFGLLTSVCRCDPATAQALMARVDADGRAELDSVPPSEAEAMVAEVRARAAAAGAPLRVILQRAR